MKTIQLAKPLKPLQLPLLPLSYLDPNYPMILHNLSAFPQERVYRCLSVIDLFKNNFKHAVSLQA
jgi:hypothetical protein